MSNSIEHFLPNPESRQRLHAGPLARDIDGFATWLAVEGYARSSVRAKLQFIADLSRWLEHRELTVEALDEQRVEAFLHTRELRLRRRGDWSAIAGPLARERPGPGLASHPGGEGPIERIVRTYPDFVTFVLASADFRGFRRESPMNPGRPGWPGTV